MASLDATATLKSENTKNLIENFAKSSSSNQTKNNNHHVVPVGVFIIIFTMYLGTAALQQNLRSYMELEVEKDVKQVQQDQSMDRHRRSKVFEKLLEYENVCTDLEIFTKVFHEDINTSDIKKDVEAEKNIAETTEKSLVNDRTINMQRTKDNVIKNVNQPNQQQMKKQSTAEPIIYLFALVFIYLLIKAASDINQHYQAKKQGDTRLRRYSLHSYAQTHKQDRRSSKDTSLVAHKRHLLDRRTQSFDRYPALPASTALIVGRTSMEMVKKNAILANLRNFSSVDEQQTSNAQTAALLQQTMSNNGSNEMLKKFGADISGAQDRRCSIPVSFPGQKPKLIPTSITSVTTTRRTSIVAVAGSLGTLSSVENIDPSMPEMKRRVRMINRH